MVAKGKDASDLFPAVVKNVVSKNTEVLNSLILHYKFFLSFLCSILEFCRWFVCSIVDQIVCI